MNTLPLNLYTRDVLLVEDNPGDVMLTRIALEESGIACNLHTVGDGIAALRFLNERTASALPCPAFVLLDLNLPRMPGHEVLEQIRLKSETQALPVIVMSSSQRESDIRRAYDLGVNCYLRKPQGLDELVRVMRVLCTFWLDMVSLPACP